MLDVTVLLGGDLGEPVLIYSSVSQYVSIPIQLPRHVRSREVDESL